MDDYEKKVRSTSDNPMLDLRNWSNQKTITSSALGKFHGSSIFVNSQKPNRN